MELDLRKTAADAAYIAVGAGVLGFQQAQVRRKEAGERLATIAKDAQSVVETQAASIKSIVTDGASGVGDTATTTIKGLDPRQWVEPVIEQIKGLSASAPVQIPEQLNKAVEVGKARVQAFRGQSAN